MARQKINRSVYINLFDETDLSVPFILRFNWDNVDKNLNFPT